MKTIKENIENEIIIQKSRFITCLYKINKKQDIKNCLDKVKQKYPNATHYCYAYRLENIEKCSDDGEPSGTAGAPILHVLQMNNLNNIICIVIRYFGGIKLGAGGLVRAYTKSVTECLKNTTVVSLTSGYHIKLVIEHSSIKQVDYILKDYFIIKSYDNNVCYEFTISKENFEVIQENIKPFIIELTIIKEIYI